MGAACSILTAAAHTAAAEDEVLLLIKYPAKVHESETSE